MLFDDWDSNWWCQGQCEEFHQDWKIVVLLRLHDCKDIVLSECNCSTCSLAILSENKDSEITARSVEQELFVYIFFTECVGLINYPWGRLSFGKIEILTWRAILEFTLWNLCLLFATATMTWPRKDDADPNETFHKQAFPDAPQEGAKGVVFGSGSEVWDCPWKRLEPWEKFLPFAKEWQPEHGFLGKGKLKDPQKKSTNSYKHGCFFVFL